MSAVVGWPNLTNPQIAGKGTQTLALAMLLQLQVREAELWNELSAGRSSSTAGREEICLRARSNLRYPLDQRNGRRTQEPFWW